MKPQPAEETAPPAKTWVGLLGAERFAMRERRLEITVAAYYNLFSGLREHSPAYTIDQACRLVGRYSPAAQLALCKGNARAAILALSQTPAFALHFCVLVMRGLMNATRVEVPDSTDGLMASLFNDKVDGPGAKPFAGLAEPEVADPGGYPYMVSDGESDGEDEPAVLRQSSSMPLPAGSTMSKKNQLDITIDDVNALLETDDLYGSVSSSSGLGNWRWAIACPLPLNERLSGFHAMGLDPALALIRGVASNGNAMRRAMMASGRAARVAVPNAGGAEPSADGAERIAAKEIAEFCYDTIACHSQPERLKLELDRLALWPSVQLIFRTAEDNRHED